MKYKTIFPLLFILLFMIVVYHRTFFSNSIFTWGDWGWYFQNTIRQWAYPPQIIIPSAFGGVDIGIAQYFPVRLLYSQLAGLMSFEYFDRIVFHIPSILLPAICGYILGLKVLKNRHGATIASLVFALNTYTIGTRTGHFTLGVAFSFAPLIIALFMESIEKRDLSKSIMTGLISFLSFSYEPRAFYITSLILGSYLLYYVFIIQFKLRLKELLKIILYSILPLIVLILLCLYGVIGLLLASKTISTQILNRSLFGVGYVSIQRAFTISTHPWTENIKLDRNYQYIIPYFWAVPVLAFLGLWIGRKDKTVLYFGLVALVGIFLVKQTNQPFAGVYPWLYEHIPGFNAFREPSKFYFLIITGYSILLGYLAKIIWSMRNRWKIPKSLLFLLPIYFVLLANAVPVYQEKMGKLATPRHVPNDYLILHDFLLKNYGSYRTLYVPETSRWGYWDNSIRKLSIKNYVLTEWTEYSSYDKEGLDYNYVDHAMGILEKNISNNLIDLHGVKYVIIPPEDKENEEIFIFNWGARNAYISRINRLPYLKPIDIGTKELLIYENSNYKPIIYWTKEPEKVDVVQEFGNIDSHRTYTTRFDLVIKNIPKGTSKLDINFSENYDSQWKLRVGDFSWLKSITKKNYALATISHISPIKTNYFEINPSEIITNHPEAVSAQNTDGTYNLNLILYYAPQAYVNIATTVSIASAFTIILLLIYLLLKHAKH